MVGAKSPTCGKHGMYGRMQNYKRKMIQSPRENDLSWRSRTIQNSVIQNKHNTSYMDNLKVSSSQNFKKKKKGEVNFSSVYYLIQPKSYHFYINQHFKIINDMFYFFFCTESLKSIVSQLTACPNLDQPLYKYSVFTCGQWIPYQTAQIQRVRALCGQLYIIYIIKYYILY